MRFPAPSPRCILGCTHAIVGIVVHFLSFGYAIAAEKPKPDPSPADIQFFENRIRPVLVEHCYSCHSQEALASGDLQADLFVDNAAGLHEGGSSGPAVVPGDPEASLLLSAMRYESFEMPPAGKLDDEVIRDFEKWIEAGAADPRTDSIVRPSKSAIDIETARNHWAYQPITAPAIPIFANSSQLHSNTAIDAFILHRAGDAASLASPAADRHILIRRLYFDLIGLPPTPAQIELFINDDRPDAVERLVDQLLSSPHFGQRWARHWLDLVRFAESVTLRGLVQHEAWRYRDYTIGSFNSDLPYDEFLIQQLAGDLLNADSVEQACQQHIATTFLTLGNNNLEDQDKEKLRMDAVDEQLSVIGSAFLGQTIGCARCHDHKFDPIPTSDYYALAGILRNTQTLVDDNVSNWIEQPLPSTTDDQKAIEHFKSQVATISDRINTIESQLGLRKKATSKSVAISTLPGIILDQTQATLTGNWETSNHSPRYVGDGYVHDSNAEQGKKLAVFPLRVKESGRYEVRVSYSPGANRSTQVSISIQDYVDTHYKSINQQKQPEIDGLFISLGEYQFDTSMEGSLVISNAGANGHVIVDAVQLLALDDSQLTAKKNPAAATDLVSTDNDTMLLREELSKLQQQLKELNAAAPAQPKYMAILEDTQRGDIPIHIRGNVHQLGRIVPRGFLSIADVQTDYSIPNDQSGRLQLAQWLTDPTNPLPARVISNRIWHWLFGRGLSSTPDNFGTTGNPPNHPELLDYLSAQLIKSDWSIKSLVREIVLSSAYQRASGASNELLARDPSNHLLLRQNRKRIEAECLVDAILLNSGKLNLQHGGKTIPETLPADYGFEFDLNRRAIYWPTLRNAIPDIIKVFDGADPSLVTGQRNNSTVAPQALSMLNNPWIIAQSEEAGKHFASHSNISINRQVELAFQMTLGRQPDHDELQASIDFIKSASDQLQTKQWGRLIQSLWATIDFRYLY